MENKPYSVHYVYSFHIHNGDVHRSLAGKFLLDQNGKIHVLEDHHGMLAGMESSDSETAARKLQSLQDSMASEIVDADEISGGSRPDLIELLSNNNPDSEQDTEELYEYHRIGMVSPQKLQFKDGNATLDGYPLSHEEVGRLVENVRNKKATLKKVLSESKIEKSEKELENLMKIDPSLSQALAGMRQAVKAGVLHPDHMRAISRSLFTDTMVPTIGNRKSHDDFLSRPRQGVHVHLDANDFGLINKKWGMPEGDNAIKLMGNAIRNSLDESVGRANAKAWRVGGDEFKVHVPSHEHAARFIKTLKSNLEKIPPLHGEHGLSTSIGVGENPDKAEHALIQAKTAKKSANYKPGEAKTHAYSAIEGNEGHLATE